MKELGKPLASVLLPLLLVAAPVFAQATPEVFTVDAPAQVTACALEQSSDISTNPVPVYVEMPTKVTPAGTPRVCQFSITPPNGRVLYRWVYYFGTTRQVRTDVGFATCVGLTDCPFVLSPSNMAVK